MGLIDKVKWGVFPASLKIGSAPSPFNSGAFPTYAASGVSDRFTMGSYPAGGGYNDGKIVSGVSGAFNTVANTTIDLTNTNGLTWGCYIDLRSITTAQQIFRYRYTSTGIDHRVDAFILATGQVRFSMFITNSTTDLCRSYSYTTAADATRSMLLGKNWYFFVKNGNQLDIYINNFPIVDLSTRLLYTYGDKTFNQAPFHLFSTGTSSQYLDADVYAFFLAENFSAADRLDCVAIGPTLGYKGIASGGDLSMIPSPSGGVGSGYNCYNRSIGCGIGIGL